MLLQSILLAVAIGLYNQHVPSHSDKLPSFKSLQSDQWLSHRLNKLYPEDIFPGGGYANLPFAETRYYLFGKENGKRIVFIHGIGPPCLVFRPLVKELEKTHRILLFDLFGRGYSESPGAFHDEYLYVTQLKLIMDHVGWDKAIVLGYSLGGAITAAFTHFFPKSVERVVLISTAGLLDDLPLLANIYSLPLVGEIISATGIARPLMINAAKENFKVTDETGTHDDVFAEEEVQQLMALTQFQIENHPGLLRSYLSTTRHMPMTRNSRMGDYFWDLGKSGKQVLAIWGTLDHLIPYRLSEHLKQRVPQTVLENIEHGGHAIVTENSTAILSILKRHF